MAETQGSPLQALERAKRLFQREEHSAAMAEFGRVADVSRGQAPDVWLDAQFGMAECARLAGRVGAAFDGYCLIADHALRGERPSGRLGLSNSTTMAQSLALVLELSRLGMTVQHDRWLALYQEAGEWADRSVLGDAARLRIDQAEAMYARCWDAPERVLDRFRELGRRLELGDSSRALLVPDSLALQERQYRLELRSDGTTFEDLRPRPSDTRWRGLYRSLLLVRLQVERAPRAALEELAKIDGPAVRQFAELDAIASVLRAAATEETQVLDEYRRTAEAALREASGRMGNLSAPLWGLASFARLRLRRGDEAGWALRSLGAALSGLDWAHETLRSRGLSPSALAEVTSWSSSSTAHARGARALPTLDELFHKVWP